MVDEGEKTIETIFEKVGVLSVFVKNQAGNLNVANFAVESGGFANNINTIDTANILHNFAKNMIGGKAKRVVDVEDKGWGFFELGGMSDFETGIKMRGGRNIFDRNYLDGDVEIFLIGNGDNAELVLEFLIGGLIFGLMKKIAGGIVKEISGVETGVTVNNFLPILIEMRMMLADKINNLGLMGGGKASDGIDKTVSVAGNKIDFLTGNMKSGRDGSGDIFPPSLGGFGVIEPRSG